MENEIDAIRHLPLSVVARTVTGTFLLLLSKFSFDLIEFLLRDGGAFLGWFDERSIGHVEQTGGDLAEGRACILIDGHWCEKLLRSTRQRFPFGECFPGNENKRSISTIEPRRILTIAIDRKRTDKDQ